MRAMNGFVPTMNGRQSRDLTLCASRFGISVSVKWAEATTESGESCSPKERTVRRGTGWGERLS